MERALPGLLPAPLEFSPDPGSAVQEPEAYEESPEPEEEIKQVSAANPAAVPTAAKSAENITVKYKFFLRSGEEARDKNAPIMEMYPEQTLFQFRIVPRGEDSVNANLSAGEQEAQLLLCGGTEAAENANDFERYLGLLAFVHRKLGRYPAQLADEQDFVSPKLEQLARKELTDRLRYTSPEHKRTIETVCRHFPFMLTRGTRTMYFKLNMLRRRVEARQGTSLGSSADLEELYSASRRNRTRMKIKVSRGSIVEDGMRVMDLQANASAALEFDFAEEVGSGIGPTMEFYSQSAAALRELTGLWRPTSDYYLFPAPADPKAIADTCRLFRYMGWITARAVADERLLDLPFAEPFWELVLGRALNINDVQRIDKHAGQLLLELDGFRNRRANILSRTDISPEEKTQMVGQLVLSVWLCSSNSQCRTEPRCRTWGLSLCCPATAISN